jgi:hypothetical protein
MSKSPATVTEVLQAWRDGDKAALVNEAYLRLVDQETCAGKIASVGERLDFGERELITRKSQTLT